MNTKVTELASGVVFEGKLTSASEETEMAFNIEKSDVVYLRDANTGELHIWSVDAVRVTLPA